MGKMYENSTRVKKAVLDLKKHPTLKMPEAMKLGGFTDDEAKPKSMQMRIHRKYPNPYIATQKKGVPLEVDAKSLE